MPYIIYAYENNYIPVVDMRHRDNQYFKKGRELIDNVWEYFFEQPAGVRLEDIHDDDRVIISMASDVANLPLNEYVCLKNIENNTKFHKKFFNCTKFNIETQKYLDENCKKITNGETEILGILCRGTDYLSCHPPGHAIQPQPKEVIIKAKKLLEKFHYKKIWLATEDLNIYKMFKDEFGDRLIENKQYKYSPVQKKRLYQIAVDRENHSFNLGKEYLLSIYMLTKCKYIIAGITAGTLGAYLLSNGFEKQQYVYLWRLGLYSAEEKFYEKIFSVKNRIFNGLKYKVITFLGLKFKFEKI